MTRDGWNTFGYCLTVHSLFDFSAVTFQLQCSHCSMSASLSASLLNFCTPAISGTIHDCLCFLPKKYVASDDIMHLTKKKRKSCTRTCHRKINIQNLSSWTIEDGVAGFILYKFSAFFYKIHFLAIFSHFFNDAGNFRFLLPYLRPVRPLYVPFAPFVRPLYALGNTVCPPGLRQNFQIFPEISGKKSIFHQRFGLSGKKKNGTRYTVQKKG